MVDNQHKQIVGYRELTQAEIDKMNEIKVHGERLHDLIQQMRIDGTLDQRWVSIGETHLQQGIMALVRSVAQPVTF